MILESVLAKLLLFFSPLNIPAETRK